MDIAEAKKQMHKQNFIHLNGAIMRTLNILECKEQTLWSLRYILHEASLEELRNSFHYLQDSGYIRIQHPEGAACMRADKEEYSHVKVEITHQGMDLLMGITDNPAVEI